MQDQPDTLANAHKGNSTILYRINVWDAIQPAQSVKAIQAPAMNAPPLIIYHRISALNAYRIVSHAHHPQIAINALNPSSCMEKTNVNVRMDQDWWMGSARGGYRSGCLQW